MAPEDTIRTTELLINVRDILNKFRDVDRLEVEFHMRQQNISQLQAVVPLYGLKFQDWTLHCHSGWRPWTTEVKRDSLLDIEISTHPWLHFGKYGRLTVKLDHTRYDDECKGVIESFFRVLPLYLGHAKDICIKVTPLRREYLLVGMFENRKTIIDKVVKLVNRYWHIDMVDVVFSINRCELDYLKLASCFHGFDFGTWKLFTVLNQGKRREITDPAL